MQTVNAAVGCKPAELAKKSPYSAHIQQTYNVTTVKKHDVLKSKQVQGLQMQAEQKASGANCTLAADSLKGHRKLDACLKAGPTV